MLYVGTHTYDISPQVGQPMGAYWRYNKFIKGIRDPVFGSVLIIKDDSFSYVLVVLDDLILDSFFVNEIKEAISKRIGISPKRITIHVNHTHSTSITLPEEVTDDDYPFLLPEGWDIEEIRNLTRARRQKLIRMTAAASEIAYDRLRPAKVGFRKGKAEDIGKNRNQPDKPIDDEVSVLRFEFLEGGSPILLMNFSTHPTIAPPDNCYVSGDLVGSTKLSVQSLMGPNTVVLYTTGAAGDVSTRFTRRGSTFEEVERMGRMLGAEVVKVAESISNYTQDPSLQFIDKEVEFNIRSIPDVATATQIYEKVKSELEEAEKLNEDPGYIKKLTENLEGASVQKRLATMDDRMAFNKKTFKVVLQGLRIGDVKIIFHPFELFSGIALNTKSKANDPNIVIIGYSNNWLSYILTKYAYDENSYESYITLGVPGTEKVFEKAFLELLSQL